jgi:hypothetical protein
MSIYTNIGPITTDGTQIPQNIKYYNNTGIPPVTVSQNISDAVLGYFETVTGDASSAATLASAVIYTSIMQRVDPMRTIAEFKSLPTGQLNQYLAVFLNFSRIGTSFIGVNNKTHVDQYLARSILV